MKTLRTAETKIENEKESNIQLETASIVETELKIKMAIDLLKSITHHPQLKNNLNELELSAVYNLLKVFGA